MRNNQILTPQSPRILETGPALDMPLMMDDTIYRSHIRLTRAQFGILGGL